MRIVIDLQGAQADNRFRGIGRYSLALTKAIVHNCSRHDVIIALNGLFSDATDAIRAEFKEILPEENIRVWYAPQPVSAIDSMNSARIHTAEHVREAFLASLQPDVLLISSLFEGLVDNAVTSVKNFAPNTQTVVVLYDLIPHLFPEQYLGNQSVKNWYTNKIGQLSQADLLLAISEATRQDALKHFNLPEERVVTISSAVDKDFQRQNIPANLEDGLRLRYGLTKKIVMYTGGCDFRKNIGNLIKAFAHLSPELKREHQLAIVCSICKTEKKKFQELADMHSLESGNLVFTGYIPEEDLVPFYNIAHTFVFPSLYEGFGLPVLEAMSCGVPTIGSGTSSIPEVIGLEVALFDPYSTESIAAKLTQVLTDDAFRERLVFHALEHSKRFSWDRCAQTTISALERLHEFRQNPIEYSPDRAKPTLAYISPLPPAKSGIADYSAELIPELAKYYEIIVITEQDEISDAWINLYCSVRSPRWLRENHFIVDRILYHFGNSAFHSHMFPLLEKIPGVVVLHDFFLSGVQHYREMHENVPNAWTKSLLHSHGYKAVSDRFSASEASEVVWRYPANLEVLEQSLGIIVHSEYSRRLAREWYSEECALTFSMIPHLRVPCETISRDDARSYLALPEDAFIVCSFGLLGPTKLNHRLLQAWINSGLNKDPSCLLIFVGENSHCPYGSDLIRTIESNGLQQQVRITGWADMPTFRRHLASSDAAVQLRTLSRGETSGTVLDCMNYGVPTIVNANGSMADLPSDAVWKLSDEFSDEELVEALETLFHDAGRRRALSQRARETIRNEHAPERCAAQYHQTIERFYAKSPREKNKLLQAINSIENYPSTEEERANLSAVITINHPKRTFVKQLFVDVSELVQKDAGSGIQRVTKNILRQLLDNSPRGYRIEPVYATVDQEGYRYARRFTLRMQGCPQDKIEDDFIQASSEDIFLGLDLQPHVVDAQNSFLKRMQHRGVSVWFVVYDLLPVVLPEAFPPEAYKLFSEWLGTVAGFDGVLCISQSTAEELEAWLDQSPERSNIQRPMIESFHLGTDDEKNVFSKGLPKDALRILQHLAIPPSFLMVGTIEPRKSHAHVLEAFEILWSEGVESNLVIVGKHGWMVEELIQKLRSHRELNQRLFWLEGISDEYLEKVYETSTCLIFASEGEGFGLPLIEAAKHGLPIIARDIPVFREVAGEHAFYFSGTKASDLAESVKEWIKLFNQNTHPKSDTMPWLTWRESAERLKEIIIPEKPLQHL